MFGERRKFIIHFFLVDKTIEVRQILPSNSGRDPVSWFLKKSLLKKPGSGSFYTAEDLYLGQTVDVYGREFFIYDADPFTREWIDKEYGAHDWTPISVDEVEFYYDQRTAKPPPYNGWGDEEDSLGFCYSVHPTPPKKDIAKLLKNQGQVLRFTASFVCPKPADIGREFVICFDLADDQISVFEKPRRNSGFWEGKFIAKARLKNVDTGEYFKASDLRLGEVVTINGYRFRVTGADEYAIGRMEAEADAFPQSDLSAIVTQLRSDPPKIDLLRRMLERVDKEKTGYVPSADGNRVIQQVIGLREHESTTIVRRFTGDRGFDYFAFIALIA
jgi:rhodanese-related sulfurtransferase